jgi:branched-chain amino acid transport system substrate-binding protein
MRRGPRVSPLGRLLAGLGVVLSLLSADIARGADEAITLGAAVSLTGKYALNGAHTKDGYDLAVSRINSRGGLKIGGKPYRLEIRYYDDQSTPARATELVERLIQQDGVRFLLGPYSSALTLAILPIVERHKIPMVEANGAARDLFTKSNRYAFAVLSTSDQYLAPVIVLAVENAGKLGKAPQELRLAIATENDLFAQDVRAGVLAEAQHRGIDCVLDDKFPPELDDMSVTLTKVKMLKPDILVVSGHEKGALTAVTQIEALRVEVPIIALTHCNSAQLAEKRPEAS